MGPPHELLTKVNTAAPTKYGYRAAAPVFDNWNNHA
jgi:hypothetical protein